MRCLDTIYIQANHWLIHDLMNVYVCRARNAGNALGEPVRDLIAGFTVAAHHLQVNGRGQAEFKICVVMFAGEKKNVMSGNFSCRRLRNLTS